MSGKVTWVSTMVSLVAMLIKGCWDGDAPTIGTAVLGIIAAVQHPPWKAEGVTGRDLHAVQGVRPQVLGGGEMTGPTRGSR